MSEPFKAEVVTPRGIVLDKAVEELIAPGIMGEFGVLIGHTPMLTFIKPGVLSYLENGKFIRYAVGSGICEVQPKSVTVLVEEAVSENEIDAAQARQDLADCENQLKQIDALAEPAAYQGVLTKVKLARAKVSLTEAGPSH
ncbi:MAG: ATP synthase F1 subunit epsilon [Thermodesulfobacteriota bacterium]